MPDIYVDVGPMDYKQRPDEGRCEVRHEGETADARRGDEGDPGRRRVHPDKVGNPVGFYLDATLSEITFGTHQGQPSVTCKLTGFVATYPKKDVFGHNLTGKGIIAGGTTDRDVEDCSKAAVETAVTKSVIPAIMEKQRPKP